MSSKQLRVIDDRSKLLLLYCFVYCDASASISLGCQDLVVSCVDRASRNHESGNVLSTFYSKVASLCTKQHLK